jgi:hypothetical protein
LFSSRAQYHCGTIHFDGSLILSTPEMVAHTDVSVVVRAGSRKLAGVDDVFRASRVLTGTKLVVARPQMKYVFMAESNTLFYFRDHGTYLRLSLLSLTWCVTTFNRLSPLLLRNNNQRGFQAIDRHSDGHRIEVISIITLLKVKINLRSLKNFKIKTQNPKPEFQRFCTFNHKGSN